MKHYIDVEYNLNKMEILEANDESKEYKTSAKNQVPEHVIFCSVLIILNFTLMHHDLFNHQWLFTFSM